MSNPLDPVRIAFDKAEGPYRCKVPSGLLPFIYRAEGSVYQRDCTFGTITLDNSVRYQ